MIKWLLVRKLKSTFGKCHDMNICACSPYLIKLRSHWNNVTIISLATPNIFFVKSYWKPYMLQMIRTLFNAIWYKYAWDQKYFRWIIKTLVPKKSVSNIFLRYSYLVYPLKNNDLLQQAFFVATVWL